MPLAAKKRHVIGINAADNPFTDPMTDNMIGSNSSSARAPRLHWEWTDPFGGYTMFNSPIDRMGKLHWMPMMAQIPREMNQDETRMMMIHRGIHREQRDFTLLALTDLIEKENEYCIFVDCPGVEDLTVAVSEDGLLEITGNRKRCFEEDTDTIHQVERSIGHIRRRLTIPRTASVGRAIASYRHGVLEVHFPKIVGPNTCRRILPLENA